VPSNNSIYREHFMRKWNNNMKTGNSINKITILVRFSIVIYFNSKSVSRTT
jgi:hypothetical protein